jgi:hypothetical protein
MAVVVVVVAVSRLADVMALSFHAKVMASTATFT